LLLRRCCCQRLLRCVVLHCEGACVHPLPPSYPPPTQPTHSPR
jgi:hypothetical protein